MTDWKEIELISVVVFVDAHARIAFYFKVVAGHHWTPVAVHCVILRGLWFDACNGWILV